MARDGRVRVEIAFEGGQVTSVVVSEKAAAGIVEAMRKEAPVFELETEDGTSLVALGKVVYVKRFTRETHIGFGSEP